MKQIIGYLMLISFFIALPIIIMMVTNMILKDTIIMWTIVLSVTGFIALAVYLIDN